MKKKAKYGSMAELHALDARGQRHKQADRPSTTSVVHHVGYIHLVVAKRRVVDPEGKIAHGLATKYRA
jgi:hypothetical protein